MGYAANLGFVIGVASSGVKAIRNMSKKLGWNRVRNAANRVLNDENLSRAAQLAMVGAREADSVKEVLRDKDALGTMMKVGAAAGRIRDEVRRIYGIGNPRVKKWF